jgi:predicted nucleic acid-binding protein
MSDKSFLDTNDFVSSHDALHPIKQSIASDLIRSMTISGEAVISYQVIQEFFNIALRQSKIKPSHAACTAGPTTYQAGSAKARR